MTGLTELIRTERLAFIDLLESLTDDSGKPHPCAPPGPWSTSLRTSLGRQCPARWR